MIEIMRDQHTNNIVNENFYQNNCVPRTIWITGLSASGKSTLGKCLKDELANLGISKVDLLDGENVRNRLSRKYGFSTEERNSLARVIAKLAIESNRKGNIAIVCAISHVKQTREEIRHKVGSDFLEVYLKCSVDMCASRDYKGHYNKAFAGEYSNFVGVTEPYQVSDHPDLIIDTATDPVDRCVEILLNTSLQFLLKDKDE